MEFPREFEENMKVLLGEEFPDYVKSFQEKRVYGLRVNRNKITPEQFEQICPFPIKRIPWIDNGYYYAGEEKPAKHPYYYAGLYYLQEPSAMTPANCLPIEPGDVVLDICAAPGGKSTELGARLAHEGLLVTNDISNSRAKALLKNIELFGIDNVCVMSEAPYKMAPVFQSFFDKILVDAPCSGEGMFRKDQAVMRAWTPQSNETFSKLQREILDQVVGMLKPGGMLLYSTCTFSPMENEQTVSYVLEHYPELSLVKPVWYEGFSTGRTDVVQSEFGEEMSKCIRIWPHKMEGEGHFVALFQKEGEALPSVNVAPEYSKEVYKQKELMDFLACLPKWVDPERLMIRQEKVYLVSEKLCDVRGLRIMRSGLLLGECKKNRFEPSQALAMALKMEEYPCSLSLPLSDDRVIRYLKGETLMLFDEELSTLKQAGGNKTDWCLVGVDGFPLGFAKISGGTLKNKYLSGWRWQ